MKLKLDKQSKTALFIILGYIILLSVLAYFRFAIYDEKLYLHETAIMSEVLKNGEWIGRYGVGVHGFLFKLPVALVYLITGPSIYVATFFHIILSAVSGWIFYLIIRQIVSKKWLVIPTLLMLLTNFSYISWSTTFHREIPVLFATTLFLYIYIFKDFKYKSLITGLCLMLILDAKEYVFFILLPALIIHIFIVSLSKDKPLLKTIPSFIKKLLPLLIPSLIYLFLMFYTNLIPINMFNASLFGLTESGFSYQKAHIMPDKTLSDATSYTNNNVLYNITINITNTTLKFLTPVINQLKTLLAYGEKFFYISNFSFQSISLVVLIPSMISSLFAFKKWGKENKKLLILNLFYWSYIFIFIIRASKQRYLFPIIPISLLFFVLFLIYSLKEKDKFELYYKITVVLLVISTVISIFYQDLSDKRILLNIATLVGFTVFFTFLYYTKKYKKIIVKLIVCSVIFTSLFITSYALITKNQLYKSLTWGINGEADKIAELLEPEDVVFVNYSSSSPFSEFAYLINVYRPNSSLPIEWHWKLDRTKIKRSLDKNEPTQLLFSKPDMNNLEGFKEELNSNEINKIILLESTIEDYSFPLQEHIQELMLRTWVELEVKQELKNKTLYIFTVTE